MNELMCSGTGGGCGRVSEGAKKNDIWVCSNRNAFAFGSVFHFLVYNENNFRCMTSYDELPWPRGMIRSGNNK